jgi:hypothetical protein
MVAPHHELHRQGTLSCPDAHADGDDRLADADDHERPVALGEMRDHNVLEVAKS